MKPNELIAKIENGELDKSFKKIYVSDSAVEEQKPRYIRTIKEFINLFGDDRDVFVLSAPGRTEVCGNHTDHNNGKVLAASINLDAIAIAAKRDDMKINEKSEGHGLNEVDISTLSPDEAEYGRSAGPYQFVFGMGTCPQLEYRVRLRSFQQPSDRFIRLFRTLHIRHDCHRSGTPLYSGYRCS